MKTFATKIISSTIWGNASHIKTLIWLLSQESNGLTKIALNNHSPEKRTALIDIVEVLKREDFCDYTATKDYIRVVFAFRIDSIVFDGKGLDSFIPFVKAYPGTKREPATEFSVLKKHKDWRSVLPKLGDHLERQKIERSKAKSMGVFVSGWKNLQTYLRNRGWEEQLSIPENVSQNVIKPRGI